MKVLLVAGARPNFMKIAPIHRAASEYPDVDCRIVHTGQHYDHDMSQTFFDDLGIPAPAHFLDVGPGSHAHQTARIMTAFEETCLYERPDLVMVVGDVNSTLACSITAKKLGIPVAHVEAGLRSGDRSMPEEINRLVTDAISDLLFVTEPTAATNLLDEGKSMESIHFVGHVMVDNLLFQVSRIDRDMSAGFPTAKLKDLHPDYAFMTLHRPSNVDDFTVFSRIVDAINAIAGDRPILFPVHPRTRKMIEHFGIRFSDQVIQLPPLGFSESLWLWKDAAVVLTDSGGLQEETTALGVRCLTLRENTERPVTVDLGTNILAGTTTEAILQGYCESLGMRGRGSIPPLWDGRASERIWRVIVEEAGLAARNAA